MKTRGYIFGILVIALLVSLLLCGCGKKKAASNTDETTDETTATTVVTTTGTTAAAYPFVGYVNATTLNVRPTADTNGYPIGGLKWGDTVTVTSRDGDWYAIAFKGQTGYVHVQYIQNTPPVATTVPPETTGETTTTTAP